MVLGDPARQVGQGVPVVLRLIPLLFLGVLHAQEITIDHITAAVCQVESGCIWNGPGNVSGRAVLGRSGESGPWQAMDYTVKALGRSPSRNHSSVSYAETTFRLWYSRLLSKHGTPEIALAAYHRGSGGTRKKEAKEYASRVVALAERLASEQQ